MTDDDQSKASSSAPPPARAHRARVLKRATIVRGVDESEIGCTVRNQHSDGAELIVPAVPVPGEFLLYVPADKLAYRCLVRWRRNDHIGVQFTGTEPKPKHHYG
ncbi:PilZ domain-containing protein [Pseudaminobacter sp. 19-2017]|uniref:PilZ domain-containing protein n=1 Tax=Pseudaminobacter soli (ex Zhang et al. 2022) TaxID=2831468 RepID=A0A942DYT2_9HYPH|nr:PilZ domain-containing protein [Pseudaminobacter soli]MBS3647415.1 PilZ domain-containing protein [Pseudaminobacter soli]